jgi:hypothetical protein
MFYAVLKVHEFEVHITKVKVNVLGKPKIFFVNLSCHRCVVFVQLSCRQWEVRHWVFKVVRSILLSLCVGLWCLFSCFFFSQLVGCNLFVRLVIGVLHLHHMGPDDEFVEQCIILLVGNLVLNCNQHVFEVHHCVGKLE